MILSKTLVNICNFNKLIRSLVPEPPEGASSVSILVLLMHHEILFVGIFLIPGPVIDAWEVSLFSLKSRVLSQSFPRFGPDSPVDPDPLVLEVQS